MTKLKHTINVEPSENRSLTESVLIYGPSGSGKTILAATVTHHPLLKRGWFFDLENGSDSINPPPARLFTPEQLDKIELISIKDFAGHKARSSSDDFNLTQIKPEPRAAASMLTFFGSANKQVYYSPTKQQIFDRSSPGAEAIPSWIGMEPGDFVIIDTLSILAESLYTLVDMRYDADDGRFLHGKANNLLDSMLKKVQNPNCAVIATAHLNAPEDGASYDSPKPNVGTKRFAFNVGRYFNAVVFASPSEEGLRFYSNPTNPFRAIARSRRQVDISKQSRPSVATLFEGTVSNYAEAVVSKKDRFKQAGAPTKTEESSPKPTQTQTQNEVVK